MESFLKRNEKFSITYYIICGLSRRRLADATLSWDHLRYFGLGITTLLWDTFRKIGGGAEIRLRPTSAYLGPHAIPRGRDFLPFS